MPDGQSQLVSYWPRQMWSQKGQSGKEVAPHALDSISSWLVPDPGMGGADAAAGLWLGGACRGARICSWKLQHEPACIRKPMQPLLSCNSCLCSLTRAMHWPLGHSMTIASSAERARSALSQWSAVIHLVSSQMGAPVVQIEECANPAFPEIECELVRRCATGRASTLHGWPATSCAPAAD